MATTSPVARDLPALMASTMCEAFQITAGENAEQVALRTPGAKVELTFAEVAQRIRDIATGLHALGVRPGDTVGLMLLNRPEFNLCDAAAIHLGATPFSIYNTSSPEQVGYLFANAANRVVITELQFLETIRAAGVDSLEQVICVDDAPEGTLALADVEAAAAGDFDFEAAWRAVTPDELITICYTSGTTGPPKGVELTHANTLAEGRALSGLIPMVSGDRITSYLPHAHMADRFAAHYAFMLYGCEVTVVADPRQIAAALPQVRPDDLGHGAAHLGEDEGRTRGRDRIRARPRAQGGRSVGNRHRLAPRACRAGRRRALDGAARRARSGRRARARASCASGWAWRRRGCSRPAQPRRGSTSSSSSTHWACRSASCGACPS